jgi:hypothetical protein
MEKLVSPPPIIVLCLRRENYNDFHQTKTDIAVINKLDIKLPLSQMFDNGR